ncbi:MULTISPECIES: FAD-dependent oxidoreductase [Mycobacterium]|uniref:FAD-dependent oxidoreductase n=1 Tax=Mycobacterium TaxID=1763 RepID=UPI001EE21816|nr:MULTISPECIES: FAD-dependent oxidoreductase [Mycobacterium]
MSECITTPASRKPRPTVAVLGAGIAGLTAAHELAERGFVVTVYEARRDERNGLGTEPPGTYPPVKLGGLAASQYSTVGTHDGSQAELRPFPGRRGQPRDPGRAAAGEHGFRFFPAYYLHIWDLFQRTPVYQLTQTADGTARWTATSRTVYDNVRRVVTKGTTVQGQPSLVFPSELPRSFAEFLGILSQFATLSFTPGDITTFQLRMLRYLATSPLRRARELQNMSAYDFLVGHDRTTGINQFFYTPPCDALLRHMPRILVALDSQWGDARTNLSTYLQLYLSMDRRDNKADGVLNGPTTESWLDHWYRHLVSLGVGFVHNKVTRLDPPAFHSSQPPHLRPRAGVTFADGTQVTPDYIVVAVDAPAAEYVTTALRAAGTGGTVARLDGYATIPPPPEGPLQPETTRPRQRRDPYSMDQMGRVPWDRFQTLCGIQYYFDTEFQLLRGHMLFSGTEWALSSINQTGFWEKRPSLDRDGHVSVLSVDIADFNTPSSHLVDEFGRGKAARDCTADEIAAEVWRQIVCALTSCAGSVGEEAMPWPVWYALDRSLIMADGPGQGRGRVVRNESPYLVPIVGDWNNRPGSDPWNPHGSSWSSAPSEDWWLEDLQQRNVWQARHGGYQVHNNSVVFAGTWNKTFTRVTSMEAACESGRHAVNAILDHYIWVESGGVDRRDKTTLDWKFPFGFLDQGLSSPIRLPTSAGDYCYVFDIENREPAETRALRTLDSKLCQQSLPHPLDSPVPFPLSPTFAGGPPMSMPFNDFNQQLLNYLQTGRQLLEQWTAMTAGSGFPVAPPMPAAAPFVPYGPPMPSMPSSAAVPPAPADYSQQLFGYLQAWRQFLESATGAAPAPTSVAWQPNAAPPTGAPANGPSPTGAPANGPGVPGAPGHYRPPDVPIPPADDNASKGAPPDDTAKGSGPTWPPPVDLPPSSYSLSQISSTGSDLAAMRAALGDPSAPIAPGNDFGYQIDRIHGPHEQSHPASLHPTEAAARAEVGSPFRSAMNRVQPTASPQPAPRSLFTRPGAQRVRPREAGETPSP